MAHWGATAPKEKEICKLHILLFYVRIISSDPNSNFIFNFYWIPIVVFHIWNYFPYGLFSSTIFSFTLVIGKA